MKSVKRKVFSIILIIAILIGICAASTVYAMGVDISSSSDRQSNQNSTASITEVSNNESMNTLQEAEQSATTGNDDTSKIDDAIDTTQENTSNNTSTDESNHDLGLLAAALATGLSCIGAGIAVAMVASSAIGAISENPGLLGKTIIFAGLAEGIAIYGLIISIMILNKI